MHRTSPRSNWSACTSRARASSSMKAHLPSRSCARGAPPPTAGRSRQRSTRSPPESDDAPHQHRGTSRAHVEGGTGSPHRRNGGSRLRNRRNSVLHGRAGRCRSHSGIDLCGANSVVVPLPTLSGPGSLADRTGSIGWVRPSAGICSPAAAEAASTTTPDCPCRTPPVRIKGDIERSAGTGWPQSYLLAIWMRLPQVSSSTAMVTPPMSTGSWVKRTPSARSRSNSARALSTASDVNGMPFSSAAFLGDPAGQRRLVHVQLAGDLRDRAARIQHQRR